MDRKQLKQAGKNLFQKNYWHSVLVALFMTLTWSEGGSISLPSNTSDASDLSNFDISVSQNFFFETPVLIGIGIGGIVLTILSYLVFNALRCGGIRYFLKSRKNQPVDIKEVVENFKDKTFLNIAKVTFFRDVRIFLWMLLFIVPGIIKSFEYWAVDYILAVRPDIDEKEARRLSKILMDGNKWDCFVLGLSFLGWILLSLFTFGLLNIFYVNPYMQATFVEYFSEIRLQALAKGTITPNDIPDYEAYNPFYQNPYDQPQNNFYAPQYNTPAENNFYAPQQPVQEPVEQPVAQPTEPVVEEPVVETPVTEPVSEETVTEPVVEPIIETTKEPNE